MNALIKKDEFSRDQIDLIKQTVARGATDNELKLFLYAAQRTGLDPLTKQIYFIKRRVWSGEKNSYDMVGTIQTGIDGYRVIAARNGLAGIDDAVFDTEDKQHPNKASVTVYRLIDGNRVPFTASARWMEYVQTDKEGKAIAMWAKMPYLMLGKVAESLALRKAFPADLSGVYTSDELPAQEMERVDPQTGEIAPARQVEPPSKAAEALIEIAADRPIPENAPPQGAAAATTSAEPGSEEMSGQAWRRVKEKAIKMARAGEPFSAEQEAVLERMERERPEMFNEITTEIGKAIKKKPKQEEPIEPEPQPNPGDDPDAYRVWLIDQMSRLHKTKDLNDFFNIQRPLWEPCFPPDIEDWESLFKERASELQ